MASFQDRVIGALKLQASTFEEVENDATATQQAATVVVAAAVSRALPGLIWLGALGFGAGLTAFVLSLVLAPIAWAVGSYVLFYVGTKLMPGKNTQADWGQLLRVSGFAASPGLFGILVVIPILGLLIGLGLAIWQLIALVIGVKQALEYDDTMKAVIVCVIAMVIMWIIMAIVGFMGLAGAGLGSRFM
ncbi:MAG TPA: YIP1 family protein [Vicinamibacterales bacterium]|nr:YIP1 family protein [Vicinamibacterales bacterium]